MRDYATQWQLWRDINLGVTEIVETNGLKDVIYHDDTFELRVYATGRQPEDIVFHFLDMPWFVVTSRFEALGVFTRGPIRGMGFHKYAPYSWTLRKVK